MNLACSNCGQPHRIPPGEIRRFRCSRCAHPIDVPAAPALLPVAAPAQAPPPPPGLPAPIETACGFCGTPISPHARKCPHCRETVDPALRAAEDARHLAGNHPRAPACPYCGGAVVSGIPGWAIATGILLTLLTCFFGIPFFFVKETRCTVCRR